MGAAAGAAAATWFGKRRYSVVGTADADAVEPEAAELPLGRSADPEVDIPLSRTHLPQDDTSGATLLGDRSPSADDARVDAGLEDIWNASEGTELIDDESERYDAVNPESLGSVWLERATQTTHGARPHTSEPGELLALEDLTVSEATLKSAGVNDPDEDDEFEAVSTQRG